MWETLMAKPRLLSCRDCVRYCCQTSSRHNGLEVGFHSLPHISISHSPHLSLTPPLLLSLLPSLSHTEPRTTAREKCVDVDVRSIAQRRHLPDTKLFTFSEPLVRYFLYVITWFGGLLRDYTMGNTGCRAKKLFGWIFVLKNGAYIK